MTVTPEQVMEWLAAHPSVAQCELIDGIAYVVRQRTESSSKSLLDGSVEDWELKEFLVVKVLRMGGSQQDIPKLRLLDALPERLVPFTFVHVLDSLFSELDTDGTGEVSYEAFAAFCRERQLFNSSEHEVRDVFFSARSLPSTSEMLFSGGGDMFKINAMEKTRSKIRFYEFQKLILEAGLLEMTSCSAQQDYHSPTVSYFVEERIAETVVRRWLSAYDRGGKGHLDFDDYARLVADYHLPFAASEEAFRRLDIGCTGGLGPERLRALLEEAGVLETGTSVDKDDAVGKIWRDIKDAQQFLPPTGVFVADGREGVAPPKRDGHLRFVCISDTHGHHRELTTKLPAGDVLLHSGDFTMSGEMEQTMDFAAWLQSLPFEKKIVIAGNHDLSFDRSYHGNHGKGNEDAEAVRAAFAAACAGDGSLVYLEDEEQMVHGLRVYGTPWQPEFGYWAFNLPRGSSIREKWRAVPEGIDVLLVHGPPLGRGDACLPSLKRAGCADLLEEIQGRIRPKFAVFGHVHEGAGATFDGTTHFVNACSLNEHYECIHAPLVFDLAVPEYATGCS